MFASGAPHLVQKRASELSRSVAQRGQAMSEPTSLFFGFTQLLEQLGQ
jgi:hypothetical protein